MPDKLTLEIAIKTTLEGAGFKPTAEEVKTLAREVDKATQAGGRLNLTSADLAKGLEAIRAGAGATASEVKGVVDAAKLTNDQLLELEEKLRADIKAAEAFGKSADDLKAKLAEVYNTRTGALENSLGNVAGADAKAATTAATVTREFGHMKTAAAGAGQVLGGLAVGGIGGLNQAFRGLITTISSLAKSALGPVIGLALAAAGAAFAAFTQLIEQNRAKIEQWANESKARAETLKTALGEIDAAAKVSLESQLAQVEKLSAAYSELTGNIERARARTDALGKAIDEQRLAEIDAREAEALEQAKTPQAQAGVKKKFAADRELVRSVSTERQITDKEVQATVDQEAAKETIREAQTALDTARQLAEETAAAAKEALQRVEELRKGRRDDINLPAGQALRDEARVKKAAADKAAENFAAVEAAQRAVVEAAQDKLEDAELSAEIAKIARQKFDAEKRTLAATNRVAEAKEREARIAEQVAKGISRQVAEGREKPNLGGTAVDRNGNARVIDPGSNATPQEKAASEAIKKSQKPAPLPINPNGNPKGPIYLGPPKTTTAPVNPKGAVPTVAAATSPVLNADAVTNAIESAPKVEPVDLQPVANAFGSFAQQTAQTLGKMNVDIGTLAKQIDAATQQIAALTRGLQAANEARQS